MSEYTDELDAIAAYLKDIADELARLRRLKERESGYSSDVQAELRRDEEDMKRLRERR